MKRVLTERPEPLLLIVPLLLLLLHAIFIGDSVPDIHQPQNQLFLQLDIMVIFWMAFSFIVVPLQIHFLLRKSDKWDGGFCRPQVYITIALLLLLFMTYHINLSYHPSAPANYVEGSLASRYMDTGYHRTIAIIFLTGIFVQFLFVIYFLIRMFQKVK